jgi:hypothetical protein
VAALQPILRPVVEALRAATATDKVTFEQVLEYLQFDHTIDRVGRSILAAHPDNPATKATPTSRPRGSKRKGVK